jgi:hypothetical protein
MAERRPDADTEPRGAQEPRLVTAAEAAEAWARLEAAFTHASATHPERVQTSWWRIAGRTVRGRVAGRGLAERVGQAFTHLRIDDPGSAPPDLMIDLWDGEETAVASPATIFHGMPGWHDSGGLSTVSADRLYYLHELFESRAILNRAAQRIIGWTASSERLSLYERGKPFRVLLSVWLHDRGIQVIHAALVAKGGRGILLPGRGGAGKTTSALACLLAGLEYLGDDYVGLERLSDSAFVGHSLYDSTWLEPDHLLRFPPLIAHAIRGALPWERKRLVHLSEVFSQHLARTVPIHLVALPRRTGAPKTRSRPASKAEAVLAMVPTSIFELTPRVGPEGFARLVTLASRLPTHWLELGEHPSDVPACLEGLLAEVGG